MPVLLRRLAIAVSWIGHPLVFVTMCVAIVVTTQFAARTAIPILLSLVLVVVAPIALLLYLGVRSGRWQDADVSQREERKRFYPLAIPLSALGTFITWMLGAPRPILRGSIITLLLLIVAAGINLRFKISLHTLFATYCTVILFGVGTPAAWVALLLAALVFWSRLFLSRHSLAETIGGVGLGLAAGIVTAWT
jgi:membrane-associated phospholipid phosphatase